MAVDGAKLFGNPIWVIEVPERPADLVKRWHNKYAKEALREAVEQWHQHRDGFGDHFKRTNRQKFNHYPRTERYKRYKQKRFKTVTDLVKTGRTERRMMSQWKMKAGGNATDKTLNATLVLTFPFKGGTGRFRKPQTHQAVTIERMITELQRFDEDDPVLLADLFGKAYWKRVEAHRSKRKRIRIGK